MLGLVVAAYAIGYFHTGTLLGMGECVAHNSTAVLAIKAGAKPPIPPSIPASHHRIVTHEFVTSLPHSYFSFGTNCCLLSLEIVAAFALPLVYEKYEEEVDGMIEVVSSISFHRLLKSARRILQR